MKKKYFILLLAMLLFIPVFTQATNNVVKLTNDEEGQIYYHNDEDSKYFIYHDNMTPGRIFTDLLSIENDTDKEISLYLKAEVENVKGDKELELLDNIEMKLYLDDILIYDGKARGLDYKSVGVNLQDAILLKDFAKNEKVSLRAETKITNEYSEKSKKEDITVIWKFYAQIENEEPVEVINDSGKSEGIPLLYTVGGIAALAVVGVLIYGKRSGRWLFVFAPWTSMKLEIPRIDLKEKLHPHNDKKNKIENIMIMEGSDMPDVEGGCLTLIGKIDKEDEDAIFNEMNEVKIDDYVYVLYDSYAFKYRVYKIYNGKEGLNDAYKKEGVATLRLATCKNDPEKLDKIYLAYFVDKK